MARLKASEINAVAEEISARLYEENLEYNKAVTKASEEDEEYIELVKEFDTFAKKININSDHYIYRNVISSIKEYIISKNKDKYGQKHIVIAYQTIKNRLIISQITTEDFDFNEVFEKIRNEVFNS